MTFTKAQKIFIGIAIIVVIGTSLGGCSQETVKLEKIEKVTIAAYLGEFSSLVFIAENQGYFADNSLDVIIKEYETGLGPIQAVLAGDADFATAAEFVLVSNSFNREDLKAISTIDLGNAIELVARKDRGINNPTDLKGKKIAIPQKTQAEFFLGSFLIFNGLSIGDVKVFNMSPSELVEAISDGTVDAVMIWEPNIHKIKNRLGGNAITFLGQSGQDFFFLIVGDGVKIKDNPSVVKRLLSALLKAETFVNSNPIETQNIISQRANMEMDYLENVWQKNKFVLSLPPALIIAMEDEARWAIKNNLTNATEVPNYLDYIYFDALKGVKPEAIGIIY
jgi:NitT/TauT family transport system substrate-binding protein